MTDILHQPKNAIQAGRITFIDDAKAIAICLMVLGHCHLGQYSHNIVHSFHMPLFFLLSGVFFNPDKSIKDNLWSAVRTLLIPYFFFNFINLSICWLHAYAHPELYYNMTIPESLLAGFKGIFLFQNMKTETSYLPLGALWFLIALFNIKVICTLCSRLLSKYRIASSVIISVIALLLVCLLPKIQIFQVSSAFVAMPFFLIGFMAKKLFAIQIKGNWDIWVILLLLLYVVFISPMNGDVDICTSATGYSLYMYFINGLLGTTFVLLLMRRLSPKVPDLIHYIGQNTLIVLGTHSFPLTFFKIVLTLCGMGFLIQAEWFSPILMVFVVLLTLPFCWFINKYIPFVVGKKRNKK